MSEQRTTYWHCAHTGEPLMKGPDGVYFHGSLHSCDPGLHGCSNAEELPVGRCLDCGVDLDPASSDPAVQGCYGNRGFGHTRVVGRL
jgi:hypothetical protein